MEVDISSRQKQLSDLEEDIKEIDKDITLILQNFQWDRKHLLESKKMVACKYDSNHRIPADNVKEHEDKCYIRCQGYDPGEPSLPEPLDINADTVVKLTAENVNDILNYAMKTDPSFRRSSDGRLQPAPLTLSRLQATYTADERRALHDAARGAAPARPRPARPAPHGSVCELPSATGAGERCSRLALLAAERDLRRRRARHRRPAPAARPAHLLRDAIQAQMELLMEQQNEAETTNTGDDTKNTPERGRHASGQGDRGHGRDAAQSRDWNSKCRVEESRDNGDEHNEKRKYERRGRDGQREKGKHEYNDKYQRHYDKDCLREKRVEYDGRRGRDDHRDRRRDRSRSRDKRKHHRQKERHHRHRSRSRDMKYGHEKYKMHNEYSY